MSIDLTRFHSTFFNESTDQLEVAEQCLLLLERDESNLDRSEKINELFRAIHSIKGSSGTLGFDSVAAVAHEFESLLEKIRNGSKELDEDLIGLCYAALDLLSTMIASEREGLQAVDRSRIEGVTARLVQSYQAISVSANQEKTAVNHSKAPVGNLLEQELLQKFLIKFAPNADFCRSGNDPLLYLRELAGKGETAVRLDTSRLVALDQLDNESAFISWEIELSTVSTEAQVVELFDWVQDLCDLSVEKLTLPLAFGDEGSVQSELNDASEDSSPEDEDRIDRRADSQAQDRRKPTVHVRADRLDSLINQISEIAISHAMFKQSVKGLSSLVSSDGGLGKLDRQLRDLQDTVLSLRMLPVRVLFGRFERAVRDARSELGKDVVLDVDGADTELDKTLIEKLADPIMHLVKNALDHGVETSAERTALGKTARATINLIARHEGGSVVLTVVDDGRGIDPTSVRAKAIDLGLAKANDQLSDYQWLQFIYHPGFSTAAQVNQWSGRGVGLDVVQVAIASLGGELSLDSTVGQGTRFSIRLPLTLAIIDALMIRCGQQIFAVAMSYVNECLSKSSVEFADVTNDIRLPKVHGNFLHLLDLRSYLRTRKAKVESITLNDAPFYLVIQSGRNKALLGVDEILGQEQIVVRSLDKNFSSPSYASGATILGDGKVALILEPNSLVKAALDKETLQELSNKEVVYG
jgi:two-component system, chemotaxis family, sensor kinase CheA